MYFGGSGQDDLLNQEGQPFGQPQQWCGQHLTPPTPLHKMSRYEPSEYLAQARRLRKEGKVSVLAGMSQDAQTLIITAQRAGWTCTRSNNNHVICRAPDGATTFAVSRNLYGAIARKRMRALNKWVEKHPDLVPKEAPKVIEQTGQTLPTVVREEPAPSKGDGILRVYKQTLSNGSTMYRCSKCRWLSASPRSVTQHYAADHAGGKLKAMETWANKAARKTAAPATPSKHPLSPFPAATIATPATTSTATTGDFVTTSVLSPHMDAEQILGAVRSLLRVVPDAEVTQLRAENEALRKELEVMRSERLALRDMLSDK